MKILRILGWTLAILLFLGLIVPLLLPGSFRVERTKVIHTQVEHVFNTALDFSIREKWDPWLAEEPNTLHETIGEPGKIGSGWSWEGEALGKGKMVVEAIVPNESITSKLEFFEPYYSASIVLWKFKSLVDGKTEVIWIMEGDLKYPIERFMGPFFDNMLGKDFEAGLENLKTYCESTPAKIMGPHTGTIEIKETDPMIIASITTKTTMDQISNVLGMSYGKIGSFLGKNSLPMAGMPLAIYTDYNEETHEVSIEAAIPVGSLLESSDEIQFREIPGMKVVSAIHYGPYASVSETYATLSIYMQEHNLEPFGDAWEQYVNDPGTVENENLLQTVVYFPIK